MRYTHRLHILTILFITISFIKGIGQEAYNIKVNIKGYKKDTLLLGYRLGEKTYVKDTLINPLKNGKFNFKGEEALKGGIYLVLTKPDNSYFEFLIPNASDQKTIELTTTYIKDDLRKNLTVTGSKDNEVFMDYGNYLAQVNIEGKALTEKFKSETNESKKNVLKKQLKGIGDKVKKYQLEMIQANPNFLSSKIVKSTFEPEIPAEVSASKKPNAGIYYYRNHFWDNFDFTDSRLIRTPIFKSKITQFLEKLTVQNPDSLKIAVDKIMRRVEAGNDPDMYQYVASELLNKYANSKVICMDAVYVHIGSKYYCNGSNPSWVDPEQLEKICENVQRLKPIQCGVKAPPIVLKDMEGKSLSLNNVKAKYTVLYFWDPDCKNCTETTEKFLPYYEEWKKHGVEIFGICSDYWDDVDHCRKKIKDQNITWLNVSGDLYPHARVQQAYDIKANPFIMLLDENKEILFKRINPDQVNDILNRELGLKMFAEEKK